MYTPAVNKELRELHIGRAALIVRFKRTCRMRAKSPEKMPLSELSLLRNLIDEADAKIDEFQQYYLR
jgi:hypothetical protein